MVDNKKNDALVNQNDSHYRRTYSPLYAWGDIISSFKSLLGLRGLWSMATIPATGSGIDNSDLGKTLSYNGNPTYGLNGICPVVIFDGTGDYLSRADEPDLDILGTETFITPSLRGLTLGGWFNFSNVYAAPETMLSKWNVVMQMAYILQRTAGDVATFGINGGVVSVSSTTVLGSSTWRFIVGRFTPSTEMAIFIDDTEKNTNVVGVPANVTNTTAPFQIGGANGIQLMTGQATLCFLCASALPDRHIYALYNISKALFGK